ncbi:hypothetical protein GFS31_14010 [Leptolyngbya sp. BL0902]|nr:hypothetical protein GFS31_14010 [Leptolyngbya sp. BL0902]
MVAYLSYRNGQAAVYNIAQQLQNELATRILQEIEETVAKPHIINQLNANALLQGDINLLTGQGEHIFWQQMKIFSETNFIYCATEVDGAFLGAGRSQGGTGRVLQIQEANARTGRYIYYYDITPTGRRSRLSAVGDRPYDPRLRPWYMETKAKGKPNWSNIYLDFETRLPTITANAPVFDLDTGSLIGVCATDIILSEELNGFLRTLTISQSGIAFIMDAEGVLLATSTPESILAEEGGGQGANSLLLKAIDSENPVIRQVAQALQGHTPPDQDVPTRVRLLDRLVITLDRERYLVQVSPFSDQMGLDWRLVVVIPEADFMAQINDQNHLTLTLYLLALALTGVSGMLLARWVVRPIQDLSQSAQAITQGNWTQPILTERSDAIGDLSRSFAIMADQLKDSLITLEQRVEERNLELTQLNQELQRLAHSDGLTQTANRRYFDAYLDQEWYRLGREQQILSLILCDVDYFKPYNDTYGHQAGDECLKQLALVFQQETQRPADLVARYGGEEFAIILPYTDTQGAITVARQIRHSLATLAIPHASSPQGQITVSMGIATALPQPTRFTSALIAAADQALYQAKTQGRNSYCVAEDWAIFQPDRHSPSRQESQDYAD